MEDESSDLFPVELWQYEGRWRNHACMNKKSRHALCVVLFLPVKAKTVETSLPCRYGCDIFNNRYISNIKPTSWREGRGETRKRQYKKENEARNRKWLTKDETAWPFILSHSFWSNTLYLPIHILWSFCKYFILIFYSHNNSLNYSLNNYQRLFLINKSFPQGPYYF